MNLEENSIINNDNSYVTEEEEKEISIIIDNNAMLELNEDKSENYEIKYMNNIDLRPYEEYKKYINEILKDYNIFEKRPVNNRQNEFITYFTY